MKGRGPPLSPNALSERSYLLTHGRSSYYCVVSKYEDVSIILVGGKRHGCVEIHVSRQGKKLEGLLSSLSYDQRCNVQGDMVKGVGTISMLRAAITFAFKLGVSYIILKDQSTFDCGRAGGSAIDLPSIYIAKHGMTWYTKTVQAKPIDDVVRIAIENFAKACQSPLPDFNKFWDQHIAMWFASRRRGDDGSAIKARLREHWQKDSCKTMQDMLRAMPHNECDLLQKWFAAWFVSVCHLNLAEAEFEISPGDFVTIALDVKDSQFPYGDTYSVVRQRKQNMQDKLKYLDYKGGCRPRALRFSVGTMADF